MHICGYFAASETRLMNIKQHTRSECLTCTFRASCCSARLSRPSPVPLSGTGYNTPAPSLLLFLKSTLIPRVYSHSLVEFLGVRSAITAVHNCKEKSEVSSGQIQGDQHKSKTNQVDNITKLITLHNKQNNKLTSRGITDLSHDKSSRLAKWNFTIILNRIKSLSYIINWLLSLSCIPTKT